VNTPESNRTFFGSAKGIASGMPLGAIIARESVMRWKPGAHGTTFGGNRCVWLPRWRQWT